jgi:hypothetical protein
MPASELFRKSQPGVALTEKGLRMNIPTRASTRVVLVALAVAVASGLATIVVVAQPDPYFLAGAAHRTAASDAGRAVARVNNRVLSLEDVELRQALVQLNNSVSPSKVADPKAAFRAAVRDLALFDAAVGRGLEPTAADVDVYVESIRAEFAMNPAAHDQLASYLRGFGLSEDAFFARDATRARYAAGLAIARLRQRVAAPAWSSFSDQVVATATVDILDPAFR